MKTFKIGNLILTKKGILIIALGFFCTGVLLGAFLLLSAKSESNLRILVFLILNIPIWIYLFPKIEKEITKA